MSKREAAEAAIDVPPAKRLYRGGPDDLYIDDAEDDLTSAHTPYSTQDPDSPQTVNTAATTPRAKFPSDLKTLACTWPGCPKTFNRPARLRDHLNSHTNSRPFKCPYDGCEKDYIEDKHLKQHIKAVHTLERKHVCQKEGCGKSFVTGTRLKRHQAVHEGEERFRCQDCGQSFRKKETLSKHVRKDHQGLPALQCPEQGCRHAFESKAALKRHRDKDHGEAKFWCGECGLKRMPDGTDQRVGFTAEVLLQAHIRQEHQNCIFCEFKSASRWELEKHVEMHHSGQSVEDRKNIACPYDECTKKFTKKSNLNAHIRTAHEGFRFVCGQVDLNSSGLQGWTNDQGCGDKFSTKSRLEDHIRYKHLGHERPKLSKPEPSQEINLIDELSGAANQAERTISCPHCHEAFIRYHDRDAHVGLYHPLATDPSLILAGDQLDPAQFFFDESFPNTTNWPGIMPEDDIFAAAMDYGHPRDDWPEDETNILLLARDPAVQDPLIDPALGTL
ncbi:transcription factor IIIA [Fusarium acutatum]|uniref:Transcription factor IIIA n=1 Tax=Fusarium acutatum TaxID=78861 RepID=A0A8H4JHD4_9HYPO|nr:transcription factor IIIA [Fusarium acutatum]